MVCKVRFSCRSPPRLRQWRTTWPEDASTGGRPSEHREGGLRTEPAGMGPAERSCPARARWPGAPPDRRAWPPARRRHQPAGARAAPVACPAAARGAVTIRASGLAAGVRPGGHDGGPGGVQHPQRLPVPTLARRGEVVAGRASRPARMASRASLLAPWRPHGRLGRSITVHPLALVNQEPGQSRSIAAACCGQRL